MSSSIFNINNFSPKCFQKDMIHLDQIKDSINNINLAINTNLLFLDCQINEYTLSGMVDSGATHCYMSEQTFEKRNNIEKTVKITPINYQAQLADGSLTTCKGCVQLNTKIDDKLLQLHLF